MKQNKTNYDLLYKKQISELDTSCKPTLLLHSCCAPCSSLCLERLTKYFLVTVFYFNPNITSSEEYFKRLNEQIEFCKIAYGNAVKVVAGSYNPSDFYTDIKGREQDEERGLRCKICYEIRIEETAKFARENGFNYFTTTLSVSPHKNEQWLNELLDKYSKIYGVNCLFSDFKKDGGYLKSIELSKQYNLYRQNYCGCEFSKR
ncbi:MAG: epoxyqueuosine reductase QueH [Clostridia bacterium]|nr:epoxyqueuosine reductase QueH [Clostridia bacterium]